MAGLAGHNLELMSQHLKAQTQKKSDLQFFTGGQQDQMDGDSPELGSGVISSGSCGISTTNSMDLHTNNYNDEELREQLQQQPQEHPDSTAVIGGGSGSGSGWYNDINTSTANYQQQQHDSDDGGSRRTSGGGSCTTNYIGNPYNNTAAIEGGGAGFNGDMSVASTVNVGGGNNNNAIGELPSSKDEQQRSPRNFQVNTLKDISKAF